MKFNLSTLPEPEQFFTVGETAKSLGWGQNKFFKMLRENKILMDNNEPYQEYLDLNYLKVHFKPRDYQRRIDLVVLISLKGRKYLKELIETLEIKPSMIKIERRRKFFVDVY